MTLPTSDPASSSPRRRLLLLALVLLGLIGLAAAWSWSPMKQWLDVDRIVGALQELGQSFGPVAAVAGFALAVSLAVPLTFLTLVTLAAFGPLEGFLCTLAGAVIGAALTHGMGMLLGREVVQRLGGAKLNLISERLGHRGVLAVIAIRMVPIAPFAIVNLVAGSSRIRLRDMLLGTAIGIAPGTIAMAFFMDQIVRALREPGPTTWLLLGGTVLLVGGGLWLARRWVRRLER